MKISRAMNTMSKQSVNFDLNHPTVPYKFIHFIQWLKKEPHFAAPCDLWTIMHVKRLHSNFKTEIVAKWVNQEHIPSINNQTFWKKVDSCIRVSGSNVLCGQLHYFVTCWNSVCDVVRWKPFTWLMEVRFFFPNVLMRWLFDWNWSTWYYKIMRQLLCSLF